MPPLAPSDIALAYLRHLERGDIAGGLMLFAPDAKARVPGHPEMGKAELDQYLSNAYARFVPNSLTFRPLGVTAEGERVAIEVQSAATLTSGLPYENGYHLMFAVREGMIRQLNVYAYGALVAQIT